MHWEMRPDNDRGNNPEPRTSGFLKIGPLIKNLTVPERSPKALTIEELKRLRRALPQLEGRAFGVRVVDIMRAVFSIQFATAEERGRTGHTKTCLISQWLTH